MQKYIFDNIDFQQTFKPYCYFFRELAEALDIDAEGSRPEQSNPVNMPTSLRHGSVPVSNQ